MFSEAVWQHERIYLPSDFRPYNNQPRLVLRTQVSQPDQPATYTLLLKRHIEDSGVDWAHATPVGDYTEASAIVHQLGYRKVAEIARQREELRLDDYMVMYLDTLEGMDGAFLKLEGELVEDVPVSLLRDSMFETLRLLDLEAFTIQTYAELALNPPQLYYLPEAQQGEISA